MELKSQLLHALHGSDDQNAGSAKEQERRAKADLKAKTLAREQIEAQAAALREVEIRDKEALAALQKRIGAMTLAVQEKRERHQEEVRNTLGVCDVRSLAQELRTDEDAIALVMSACAEANEVLTDRHRLETMVVQETLHRATADEFSAAATLCQIQTLGTLGPASQLEGRITFIGGRSEELLSAAIEQDRLAAAAGIAYQEAQRAVEAKLRARDSRGSITGSAVTRH